MENFFNKKINLSVSLSTLPSYKNIKNDNFDNVDYMNNFKMKMKMRNFKNELYLLRKKNELEEPEKLNKDYQNLILKGVHIKNNFLVKKACFKESIQKLDNIKKQKKDKIEKINKEINKLIIEINNLIYQKNLQSVDLSKMFSFSIFK